MPGFGRELSRTETFGRMRRGQETRAEREQCCLTCINGDRLRQAFEVRANRIDRFPIPSLGKTTDVN